ncbi:monovalent cation/H+ antiporter complex subunit F [Vibrio sp. Isolate25]|uniref:monovalent cation/H+ antiporter complex subunit F n=1 Tax=Vibrio TaxID=662 RepID=UPI001EFE8D26|nr:MULTISPECIES: monovalent cation/H+ antiporter complex subunit F [Vibrio]MCG9595351.1 monovalent cation/H+ antiporter complex subunit F [Vibrio sp. Isolate25]USD35434.1 cation:proton antiporter [Vibrio sp. SCSIO 43186]USD48505.1 cation:proton antiporter [Vibrio sp. SCSIO 43145]USD72558.1 cation:proton antiporter [Vibrio sp. SCSIO 43139]USD98838.1 cation:proton antiporter [Vibrio coralliilyticus]
MSITFAYLGLLLSVVMAFIRLILGPTLADRVVALDLIAFITVGFIAVYTLDSGQASLLDVAITLGLVAFLGTIAFARLIFKRKEDMS